MNDINMMLKVYKHAMSNKVKELAAPLDQCFDIDEFVYTYISNKGEYFAISNQPDAQYFYFCTGLYRTNLLIRHPANYASGPLLPGDLPHKKQESMMEKQFGYSGDKALVIFKQVKGGVHKFLFNTKKHSHFSIRHFYCKNLALFDTFCDYFLAEWQPHLYAMDEYTIDIAQLIGSDFYTINCLQEWSTRIAAKETFLKKIGALPYDFILTKPFSNQEKVCLNLLSQGKTLKTTAEEMHLSYRTAEHYLENIKNKINCRTKSEVVEQIRYLKMLDLV